MGTTLDGFPWWGQLTDPDPRTGRPDIMATTDCGEEVVSMWIAGRNGQYTDAADLRRSLTPTRSDGRTTAQDLVALLALHGIKARAGEYVPSTLQRLVRTQIREGDPVALLGNWVLPATLHWILGVGYGNNALIAMDPWIGRMKCFKWQEVEGLATGQVVMGAVLQVVPLQRS